MVTFLCTPETASKIVIVLSKAEDVLYEVGFVKKQFRVVILNGKESETAK